MNPDSVELVFDQVDQQTLGPVTRLVGFVSAPNFIPLIRAATLDANPRYAKVGTVTTDIINSIKNTPKLFPFKTKGVLLAASKCLEIKKNRYKIDFQKNATEGILDGGHNTLAIGIYLLSQLKDGEKIVKKIKNWDEFKETWDKNKLLITELKKSHLEANSSDMAFLIPVEVIIPASNEVLIQNEYSEGLLEICDARNNNVELTNETKANKSGLYDDLKKLMQEKSNLVAKKIEWKSNDGGSIKVKEVLTLGFIPFSFFYFKDSSPCHNAEYMYHRSGECSSLFINYMQSPEVSKPKGGVYVHELHNQKVYSALEIVAVLPLLQDYIYQEFPKAYNKLGKRFGAQKNFSVKTKDQQRNPPCTYYSGINVEFSYPSGLILPLVFGLKALIHDNGEKLVWVTDPRKFIDKHFDTIVPKYLIVIESLGYEIPKIGRSRNSYQQAYDAYYHCLQLSQLK